MIPLCYFLKIIARCSKAKNYWKALKKALGGLNCLEDREYKYNSKLSIFMLDQLELVVFKDYLLFSTRCLTAASKSVCFRADYSFSRLFAIRLLSPL